MSSSCKVCTAKRAGLVPQKRKCTCNSGVTAQRNRKAAVPAAERDPPMWEAIPLWDEEDIRIESSGIDAAREGRVTFVPNPAASDFHEFEKELDWAAMTDDLAAVQEVMQRSKLNRLTDRYAFSVEEARRNALATACLNGSKELVEYWLDSEKLLVSDRCPHYDPNSAVETPCVAATPLHIAAAYGQAVIVQELLSRGADAALSASDGTTPFYRACEQGSLEVVRLLHSSGVDTNCADPEGTAPVHIATANGHADVVEFLHEHGVSMEVKGNIHLGEAATFYTGVTPLVVAQKIQAAGTENSNVQLVLQFLQNIAPKPHPVKRQRSTASIFERAVSLGVADRLREIPACVYDQIDSGSASEREAAKTKLHALQKANQQIVSRAEQARLKQSKLI